MLHHIRPHKVFTLVENNGFYNRMIHVVLPWLNTPILLETSILVALTRAVEAENFFEFGTYKGINTLNITASVEKLKKIYTLDLDEESFKSAKQDAIDREISKERFRYEDRIAFKNTPYENKIQRLFGDSTKFDYSPYHNQIDMMYIDGGHDYNTVKSDTENAFKMLTNKPLGAIAWHDYTNRDTPDVTYYLSHLAEEKEIFHVEETMVCFYLKDDHNKFLKSLI